MDELPPPPAVIRNGNGMQIDISKMGWSLQISNCSIAPYGYPCLNGHKIVLFTLPVGWLAFKQSKTYRSPSVQLHFPLLLLQHPSPPYLQWQLNINNQNMDQLLIRELVMVTRR